MLHLWNTRIRTKEEFTSIRPHEVGFYACGPTVYGRAHIGNLRAYILEDVLRRTLEAEGYYVKHVMNITDVGHLTDDADSGEDKMEREAREAGKSAWDIAKMYTELLLQDMSALHILKPTSMPRATETIPLQIELIQILEKKGYTYTISDGVYFDTSKWDRYGSFSRQPLDQKEEGARIQKNPEKRNPSDFALWKFSPKDQQRQMEWESPWGTGFPGWHIECSAMSQDALGQPFDIHAGGVDHLPVHHENEIAQSEAAFGVPLANWWMHIEFLLVDNTKMSKSLGNAYTLSDMEERGIDPLAFRYFVLGAHYRQKQNFTWDALKAAATALNKLRNIVRDWEAPDGSVADVELEFFDAIEDDLNTSKALSTVWKLVDSNHPTAAKSASLIRMDQVLGLNFEPFINAPIRVPREITELMTEREHARAAKNWSEADRVRRAIEEKGWTIDDTPQGPKARPV